MDGIVELDEIYVTAYLKGRITASRSRELGKSLYTEL